MPRMEERLNDRGEIAPPHADVRDLHICPSCASHFVQPTEWEAIDEVHWRVALRCPECDWRAVGVHEQAVMDRYDRVLDAGADVLLRDLRALERENMETELRRFQLALGDDLVLPEDF
jgi:hypothetical protein